MDKKQPSAPSSSIAVLGKVPFFTNLPTACKPAFEHVASQAVRRHYTPNEVVFIEGESCTGLYIVEEGWLKSSKSYPSGREQVVRAVGSGECFNEVGILIPSSTNLVTVTALESSTVWIIHRESLFSGMEGCSSLAISVAQNLARRAAHLLSLVEDLSLRDVESRLAHFLLSWADEGELQRRRWLTQAEMSAQIGTVPDVLNRALRKFSEEGLIEVERHRIKIVDPKQLQSKAGVL
jgi:CRP/FNR family transcriptional regulator